MAESAGLSVDAKIEKGSTGPSAPAWWGYWLCFGVQQGCGEERASLACQFGWKQQVSVLPLAAVAANFCDAKTSTHIYVDAVDAPVDKAKDRTQTNTHQHHENEAQDSGQAAGSGHAQTFNAVQYVGNPAC